MELIDRYVHAVRFWLPKRMRDEVTAELAEDLRSQVEAREAELHRALESVEVSALIERWGPPLAVAQRYLPPRHLIGPALFPLYALALKIIGLVYLLPWLLVWGALAIFDASYRDQGLAPLKSWWLIAMHLTVVVTALFFFLERSGAAAARLTGVRWRALPPPTPDVIPRSQSIGESVGAVLVILWWVGVLTLPQIPEVTFVAAPIWTQLNWPIVVFYAAFATFSAVATARPWWTRAKSAARLILNAAGAIVISAALLAGQWVVVAAPSVPVDKVARFEHFANLAIGWTLAIIGIAFVVRGVQDWRRLTGRRPLRHWLLRMLAGE